MKTAEYDTKLAAPATANKTAIPVAAPVLAGNERAYVLDVLGSTQLSMGAYVERFEAAWARECSVPYGLSCSNGTAALHLALLALGVKPGDEVIVPTLTFIATANAVTYCGARPVPVDVDAATWAISPSAVEAAITPRTVGIIAVHLYGLPCDMGALQAIAERHGLWLVEDAAQAHGAEYRGQRVGSLSDAATFSFYGNKIITCGEGGMVTTRRADVADKVRLLRGQGMTAQYWHSVIGHNYRLTDLQAAIGLAQVERLDWHLRRRRAVAMWYRRKLAHAPVTFQAESPDCDSAYWMNTVLLGGPNSVGVIQRRLQEHGIETRRVFLPLHRQPPYAIDGRAMWAADVVAAAGLTLPTSAALDALHITRVCEALENALGGPYA